jgi:catechol 2,3-dioxygenase-like lactoylglutathione lyase family enzyme
MTKIHHSAIVTHEIEESLRFWRDGIGLEISMDTSFEGDWPQLFGAPTNKLHSIFLNEPGDSDPEAGVVELVDFGPDLAANVVSETPQTGFFLLSLNVDYDATLARLKSLGLGGDPSEISTHGIRMAVVRDPNGVLVELIEQRSSRTPE